MAYVTETGGEAQTTKHFWPLTTKNLFVMLHVFYQAVQNQRSKK